MSSRWLRRGALVLSGACGVVAACGSEDGKKTSPQPGSEQAGAANDGGRMSDGGDPNATGGGGSSPSAGQGGSGLPDPGAGGALAEAGGESSGGDAPSGASGAAPGGAGAGGAPDVELRECPTGTADCDDDPNDCETNVASDAMNCGRCERACGATAACKSGLCDATVILQPNVQSNWCDAVFTPSTAYMLTCWGSFNEVRRAPLQLGASVLGQRISTFTVAVTHARGMLIDDGKVLYGVQGNPSYIYQFPLDADGPEDVSVAYTFENGTRFNDLQLVGDTFYWNHNTYTAAGQITPGEIRKRAKTGASSTTLVTGLGLNYDLQVFDTHMIWLETRTANDVNSVYRAPLAGAAIGDVELVVTAASGGFLVRHGDYAYWTKKAASPNGKLQRLLVDDSEAEVEDVATNLNLPEGLVTDESYAYFKQLDALYRVPLEGGAPEQLSTVTPANDAQATQIFYVDDTYVYLAAGATGGASVVVRVAK